MLVVAEPVVALLEEMSDVVQKRRQAEGLVGAFRASEGRGLQAVLGDGDAFAIGLAAVFGEQGRDLVVDGSTAHVSRSSTRSLDISESASA